MINFSQCWVWDKSAKVPSYDLLCSVTEAQIAEVTILRAKKDPWIQQSKASITNVSNSKLLILAVAAIVMLSLPIFHGVSSSRYPQYHHHIVCVCYTNKNLQAGTVTCSTRLQICNIFSFSSPALHLLSPISGNPCTCESLLVTETTSPVSISQDKII